MMAGDVRFPHRGSHRLARGAEYLVPYRMSKLVVDRLEVVEVGHDHRQGSIVAAGSLELLSEPLPEVTVVLEAGEPVGDRDRLETGHGLLQFQPFLLLGLVEALYLFEQRPRHL